MDLLANPFAVLGLTHDASMPAISARAREVGGADALAARSLLIAPRSRLQAELGYVPGASGPQVGACLTSLRGRTAPDLSTLGPQAQANVIAHLAFLGLASSGNLRRLFALQPAIAAAARSMLETGREAARLPAIPQDMLDAALLALAAQHAEAFGVGALALADGAALFSALVRDPATSAAVRAGFLRDAATAWELGSAAGADADCDAAAPIEAELRDRCSQRKAVELANCIQAFTRRTEPPRELARTFGLPHQASVAALERWHAVALDLNNRQGAVTEAVTVFEALVAGFGAQGDLCVKVAQNLEICRTRLASGDGTPEIRRLLRAIDVCLGSPHLIGEIIPNDWTTLVGAAAAAVELHTAFTAAARKALTSLPYALLRSLALRVHNEFGASAASLSMIRLIIFESRRNRRAGDLQSALETDQRDLETGIVRTALGAAVAKEQMAEIARLTRDLLEVSDDAAERQHCEAALMRMGSQPEARVVGWVCASVIAACVLWGVLKPSADSDRRRYAFHPTYLPSIQDPDPLTGRAETAARSLQPNDSTDHSEQEPPIGLQTLTLQQLRWCKYTNARVEAARQTLADIRATSGYRQDSYNAATTTFNTYITTLNARCVSYTYHVAELSGVVAEVLERGEQLKREGQQVVMAAYSSIALQSSPSTKPAATPASVQPNVFTARPSPAYQAGQAARQDWEAWSAALPGDARDGAEWWASVRSDKPPRSCVLASGVDHIAAVSGCNLARARLAPSDRRRRAEVDFKAGWNDF